MPRGLLIRGSYVQVPGVDILGPDEEAWVHLIDSGPYRDGEPRANDPQQFVIHKTIADDPEKMLPGAGPAQGTGGAQYSAEEWSRNHDHGGSHLIVGFAGVAACLEDLALFCAYHGNQANHLSVGLEMKERFGGGCYEAVYNSTVAIAPVAMSALGLQWQCPKLYKNNVPLPRFVDGGKSLVGCFGHRDITTRRNIHDPGNVVFDMLESLHGYERPDFYAGQDIEVWSKRQERMKELGFYTGAIDGIPFKQTTAALLAMGYPSGIFARGRELAEKPPGDLV